MSFITLSQGTRGFAPAPGLVSGLRHAAEALLANAGAATARWWSGRRNVHWLVDVDDAVLRDLGIARSDIPRLARQGRR